MAIEIKMPKLSATMQTGVIQKWRKKEGERVEYGEVIADIETDKAVMELEAFDPGVIRKIVVPEGSKAPVNETIAIIGEAGEDVSAIAAAPAGTAPSAPTNAKVAPAPPVAPPPAPPRGRGRPAREADRGRDAPDAAAARARVADRRLPRGEEDRP